MGVPAELTRGAHAHRARRRGAALPTALFGLVVLSVLGAGIFSVGSVQRQATFNRESTARALLVTEEGVAHAVAVVRDSLRSVGYTRLLRGSDDITGNADDGRITGYTLSAGLQVPNAGKSTVDGSYTVELRDDAGDPVANTKIDGNHRVVMRCTGTTTDGASAVIDVVFGATPMPAIAVDSALIISGNPGVIGACGGVHANQNLVLSGTTTSSGTVTATGSILGSGGVVSPGGATVTPVPGRERIEIPTMSPSEFCVNADYDMRADGNVYVRGTGALIDATATPYNGWKRSSASPVKWDVTGASIVAGSYCVTGNVVLSGNPGSPGSPVPLSIYATGSVEISGNPYLTPDTDDVMIVAAGDVSISGNPSSGYSYEGSIYAGAQCKISGNPTIAGQVICKSGPQPAGAIEIIAVSEISGNPVITYGCGSTLTRRKILEWIQVSN